MVTDMYQRRRSRAIHRNRVFRDRTHPLEVFSDTVCRTVLRVTDAFHRQIGQWVRMPTPREVQRNKKNFFAMQIFTARSTLLLVFSKEIESNPDHGKQTLGSISARDLRVKLTLKIYGPKFVQILSRITEAG